MKRLPQKLSKQITDRFQVENNTLKRAVKQNPKDRIELEIGDSKQPDFLPQAKIMRWDNEVNASFRYIDNEPGEPVIETEGKVIKYKKQKVEFHTYELDTSELGEDGGLEIELLLKEKPDTNKFEFTLMTKELDFFYQPALTQQEIDEGAERPENVVGSYAVYHKTKGGMNRADGMEYKTGKAFHIYRPKVTDANGLETWGELSVDEQNGLLSVTIDQTWLDNVVYPVLVDPTFGYSSLGASDFTTQALAFQVSDQSRTQGRAFTLSEEGTLDSLHIGIRSPNNDAVDISAALYREDSGGSGSHGKVALYSKVGPTISSTAAFQDFTASSEPISADDYIIAGIGDGIDVTGPLYMRYDAEGATLNEYRKSVSGAGGYATMVGEDPFTQAASSTTNAFSVYATYTADDNPVSVPVTARMMMGLG